MASKLILTRKGAWLNRRNAFKVFINDEQKGLIKNDSSEEYLLEAGTYRIKCKVQWMSSNEFTVDVSEGKNKYIAVTAAMKYYFALYILLLIGLFLPFVFRMAKLPQPEWVYIAQVVLIIPALLYMLLYVTALRKKYLVIKEDDSNPFR